VAGHPHRERRWSSPNVDIAQEFTQMILGAARTSQRQDITVSDELLADTLAIKR